MRQRNGRKHHPHQSPPSLPYPPTPRRTLLLKKLFYNLLLKCHHDVASDAVRPRPRRLHRRHPIFAADLGEAVRGAELEVLRVGVARQPLLAQRARGVAAQVGIWKANFETRISRDRLKGWNRVLSSYGGYHLIGSRVESRRLSFKLWVNWPRLDRPPPWRRTCWARASTCRTSRARAPPGSGTS
jgi:hypothetical protein